MVAVDGEGPVDANAMPDQFRDNLIRILSRQCATEKVVEVVLAECVSSV